MLQTKNFWCSSVRPAAENRPACVCWQGLEEISEGEILIGDRVVNNVAPKDRDVAMVFQSYALYPHMTVYDNMAFGLRLRKTPKQIIDQRVREAAKSLGIEQLLDRRPRQLSGGQRQRVAVGRAVVREPQVFLLDEPLSNLDAKLRVEARSFISKLHQRLGTTFIYVTHDQVEAMTMGTRICVLSAGELQQIDTPFNLYHNPRNLFVAGFIGSPSMNFFDATLKQGDGSLIVETASFQIQVPAAKAEPFKRCSWQARDLRHPPGRHPRRGLPAAAVSRPRSSKPTSTWSSRWATKSTCISKIKGKTFIARTDPRTRRASATGLGVAFNIDNLHLFDADTNLSLAYDYKQQKEQPAQDFGVGTQPFSVSPKPSNCGRLFNCCLTGMIL